MTRPARDERFALCDTALELGPAAPTLCSPWDVAALLAHLHLREARPDLAVGVVVPPLAAHTEAGQAAIASWPFERLVATVRTGPPVWNPTRIGLVDEVTNLGEMFIHHEDMRRANGMEPRTEYGSLEAALTRMARRAAPLMFRKAPVGVTFQLPDGTPVVAKKPTGHGAVTLRGPVPEIILYSSGRERVAHVDVEGPDDSVGAFRASR